VVDLSRHAGAAGDLDCLLQPFEQPRFFGAHVSDVDAVIVGHDLTERDQLIGIGVAAGGIDERGGDAERAIFHGRGEHFRHGR
jgi:hypothetical protein